MGSPSDLRETGFDNFLPYSEFTNEQKDSDVRIGLRVAVSFIVAGLFIFIKESLSAAFEAAKENNKPVVNDQQPIGLHSDDVDLFQNRDGEQNSDDTNTPALPEFTDSGLSNLFAGRVGTFDPPALVGGNTSPLLLAQNDNIGPEQSGSINPFLTADPDITVLPNLVEQGSGGGALVAGDSLVYDRDDPDPSDDVPFEPDDTGDDDPYEPHENRAPVVSGPVILQGRFINQTSTLFAAQLLLLSSDADGDDLVVTNLNASAGALALTSDGQWLFRPDVNYTGDVTFTYDVSDGAASVPQYALLRISEVPGQTIIGTDECDTLIGTIGNDTIEAFACNDIVHARAGNDLVRGGDGDDRILGGDGDDIIYGDDGNDIIYAGAGDDVVFGGNGNDTIFGEDGDDSLFGDAGADRISGGNGNDLITGGDDNDHLSGDSGNDVLDGGDGADSIYGDGGDDIIIAGSGVDFAAGGSGNDQFVVQAGDGSDTYDGGEGLDTYDLSRTTSNAIVDLADNKASTADGSVDTIENFESVKGGLGDDQITGDSSDNGLIGYGGDDELSANDGDDVLIGGAGSDTLRGDDGDDLLFGGFGDDYLRGENGNDLIIGNFGDDRLRGEDGDDFLFGGSGDDRLRGEDGDDVLFGGSGADDLEGDEGNDSITGGPGNDEGEGGDGDDVFFATIGDGDDTYDGGTGTDTFDFSQTNADAEIDLAAGSAISFDIGSDQITGFENVIAGSGNDTLMASNAVNVFVGGEGDDTFVFRSTEEAGLHDGNRDRIEDYEIGDTIDVSYIDADEDEDGDQDFDFVLDTNGQIDKASLVMRYEVDEDSEDGISTILAGFANDDQLPDFEISLRGRHDFDAINFHGVNVALSA